MLLKKMCLIFLLFGLTSSVVFAESVNPKKDDGIYLPFVAGKLDGINYYVHQKQDKEPTSVVSACSKFGIGSKSSPGNKGEAQNDCWLIGSWSGCSSSCGEGISSRVVSCVDLEGSPSIGCDASTKPVISKSCNNYSGCAYSWKIGEWGACQASCGDSIKTRLATCVDKEDNTVEDTLCSSIPKPDIEDECVSMDACSYSLNYGEWGECSSLCSTGTQTRTVECLRSDGLLLDMSHCGTPLTAQECTGTGVCNYEWEYGEWGTCSTTCGTGSQTRTATCKTIEDGSIASNDKCTGLPLTTNSCTDNTGCVTFMLQHWSDRAGLIYLSDESGAKKELLTTSRPRSEGPAPTISFAGVSSGSIYLLLELTSTVADGTSTVWTMLYKQGADYAYPFQIVNTSTIKATCVADEELWNGFYIRSAKCTSRGYVFTALIKFNIS